MNSKRSDPSRSDPPRSAIWLLRHAYPGNEALIGDLIERFHEGQTHGWLWRQVFVALAANVVVWIRRHWPHISYSIAGTAMMWLARNSVAPASEWLRWETLPWPWSQLANEISGMALLSLAALPVLATGLALSGSFRWGALVRTGVINLALITLGHFVPVWPWFRSPRLPSPPFPPGDFHQVLAAFHYLFWATLLPFSPEFRPSFSDFLISACLGCKRRDQQPTTTIVSSAI